MDVPKSKRLKPFTVNTRRASQYIFGPTRPRCNSTVPKLLREHVSFEKLKSVGPKMVPFFKTVAIFFVLFGEGSSSIFFAIAKIAPIVSLMVFVLLHGMSLDECYRYSRRILVGLVFSVMGDLFLVWKLMEPGLLCFAIAQIQYARAFGWRPLRPYQGSIFLVFGLCVYAYLSTYLTGLMAYLVPLYLTLICTMAWRAASRVHFYDDLWTWTKLCGCGGALFFVISDLCIAVNLFAFPFPFSHQIIMLTYYAAQFGISLSVVDSQADELIRVQNDTPQQRKSTIIDDIGLTRTASTTV